MVRKLIALLTLFFFTGCTVTDHSLLPPDSTRPIGIDPTQAITPGNFPHTGKITVYAAASLTGAFRDIANEFEATNPGTQVTFNFAGSQILRTQLEQGAKADVFASADQKNMDVLVADGLIANASNTDFAANKLIVILPGNNPAEIKTLIDLSKPAIKLVLADPSVPAGNYARLILKNMDSDPSFSPDFSQKVLGNVVSNETDVKQVVAKVELGEADAGIVYVTDALARPDLITLTIPDNINVIATYPIAVLSSANNPALAQAFVDYVRSAKGQSILKRWGFDEPSK